MSIPRLIEPEWLDHLPGDDPAALGSRRDLRRLNAIMFHDRIVARALRTHATAKPRSIIEIGAGDGRFMLSVARLLAPRFPDADVTLVDRQDLVSDETRKRFAALGWPVRTITADVFDHLERQPRGDVIIANLFLHHFDDHALMRLFRSAATLAPLFIACEPRRAFPALQASRLLWAIGCNGVTRHDAVVSARAGFKDHELSALWPQDQGWDLHEQWAGLFSHCFIARNAAL